MSQPTSAAPSRKKTVISLLVLAALTGIIVLLFKDNWAEITAALSQLSAWQVLVVLAIGLSYPLLEGCVAWVIVRSRLPQFKLWQGLDVLVRHLLAMWSRWVPVRCRCSCTTCTGPGCRWAPARADDAGIRFPQEHGALVRHRDAAVTASLAFRQHHRCHAVSAHGIRCGSGDYRGAGAAVRLAAGAEPRPLLLGFLPKTEKWQQRRADWLEQLEVLGTESRRLLTDKPRCLKIFALQALKLFGLFCLPYLCIRFMGLSPLGFWQVQLLTSLMLFVSNALPNVAGMGSIETAFLLGVWQFSGARRGDERADALPHRQLLCGICRQRRGLFHRPAAFGANGASKGGVSR